MSQKAEPPTTQRAYTLRLQGTDRSDQSWRDALWQTHHAANKGSKAFGDWLLTMRGGLDHTLADAKIKGEKKEPDRDPTPPERKDRRILLALSWLSVESKRGAPKEFLVASGHAPAENRNGQVIKALERILEKRGVPKPTIGLWIDDCSASLSAAIRDDVIKQVVAYAVTFLCTVLACTLWLTGTGVDLLTSFTASLTCVAN
ncbi:MAG: hypothetical protein QF599_02430, partial [Planctomycetota bacterium]|nr:hypothetical protein [Planctomycetota bacterium]